MSVVWWLVLGGILTVIALAAGGWWWWRENAEELVQSTRAAYADGKQAGAHLRESDCLDEPLARHDQEERQSLLGSIHTNLYLRGCLETSKAEVDFCEGVPAKDELLARDLGSATVRGPGIERFLLQRDLQSSRGVLRLEAAACQAVATTTEY